jgi:hypothetical protein
VIRVEPLTDEAAYAAFLRGRPDALLYHSLPFRDLLVDHLGCEPEYLVATDGGEIRGALPLMWLDGVANSLPFYGSHGDVLADDENVREALLRAWDERASDPSTAAATFVENPFAPSHREPLHDLTDERLHHATALDHHTLDRVEASARRNVAKARRLGTVVAREPAALGELGALHRENLRRIGGRAKDASFFDAVPRHFGDDYDVYTARLDGELAAGLLVFWTGAAAEYYVPGIAHDHRSDQPLAAILAEALEAALARGLRWWSWGGTWTTQDGVRRFKLKWGARELRYRYFTQVNDRALLELSPDELQARFGHFYVAPYGALQGVA